MNFHERHAWLQVNHITLVKLYKIHNQGTHWLDDLCNYRPQVVYPEEVRI